MSARRSFHGGGILRVAVVLTLFAGWCFAQAPAPVRAEGGLVQGTLEDGLTVYNWPPRPSGGLPDVYMFKIRNGKIEMIQAAFGGNAQGAIWPDETK